MIQNKVLCVRKRAAVGVNLIHERKLLLRKNNKMMSVLGLLILYV